MAWAAPSQVDGIHGVVHSADGTTHETINFTFSHAPSLTPADFFFI